MAFQKFTQDPADNQQYFTLRLLLHHWHWWLVYLEYPPGFKIYVWFDLETIIFFVSSSHHIMPPHSFTLFSGWPRRSCSYFSLMLDKSSWKKFINIISNIARDSCWLIISIPIYDSQEPHKGFLWVIIIKIMVGHLVDLFLPRQPVFELLLLFHKPGSKNADNDINMLCFLRDFCTLISDKWLLTTDYCTLILFPVVFHLLFLPPQASPEIIVENKC